MESTLEKVMAAVLASISMLVMFVVGIAVMAFGLIVTVSLILITVRALGG